MMASLKLKREERDILYYGKHRYKVSITAPYRMKFVENYFKSFDIAYFKTQLEEEINRHNALSIRYNYEPIILLNEEDYDRIIKIANFKNKFDQYDKATTRTENNKIVFYCSDIALFKGIEEIDPEYVITEAELLPSGVRYMAKQPKYKYRVYLKGIRIERSVKDELLDYIKRTPNLEPSSSFNSWLKPTSNLTYRHNHVYLQSTYFIDYDEPSVLTMLYLLFPGILGKSYKLEKRPS